MATLNLLNQQESTDFLWWNADLKKVQWLCSESIPIPRCTFGYEKRSWTFKMAIGAPIATLEAVVKYCSSDIDSLDLFGWTPIHFLAYSDQIPETSAIQRMKILLQAGSQALDMPISSQISGGDIGMTPLHLAAKQDRDLIVDYILSQSRASVNSIDSQKVTPIYHAISDHCKIKILESLIVAGASLDRDLVDSSPLEIAIRFGNLSASQFLIDRQPNLLELTSGKESLLDLAINNCEMMILLLSRCPKLIDLPIENESMRFLSKRKIDCLRAAGYEFSNLQSHFPRVFQQALDEEYILQIRFRIYFERSLLERCLQQI